MRRFLRASCVVVSAGSLCTSTVLASPQSSSLAATTASPEAAAAAAPAATSKRLLSDVLVLGGGVCGLSTSLHLSKLGYKVILLEREYVGAPHQASSVNSGLLETGFIVDKAKADESLGEYMIKGTMDMYEDLQQNLGYDIEFERQPMLWIAETPEQLQYVQSLGFSGTATHAGAQLLTPEEAIAAEACLEGANIYGAVRIPASCCASADPRKTMMALRSECARHGVEIMEHTEAVAAQHSSAFPGSSHRAPTWAVLVRTIKDRTDTDGSFYRPLYAKQVVIATGAWTAALATRLFDPATGDGDEEGKVAAVPSTSMHIPVVPVIGVMWRTRNGEDNAVPREKSANPTLKHIVGSVESNLFWTRRNTVASNPSPSYEKPRINVTHTRSEETGAWEPRLTNHLYGRQRQNGEFIFGGDRKVHPAIVPALVHKVPRSELNEGYVANYHHVTKLFPFLSDSAVDDWWAGLMPFSPDMTPIMGDVTPPRVKEAVGRASNSSSSRTTNSSSVFVISGFGSHGFMEGGYAGKMLADYMHGINTKTHGQAAPDMPHPQWSKMDPTRFQRSREK